jgi:hypothetical protein
VLRANVSGCSAGAPSSHLDGLISIREIAMREGVIGTRASVGRWRHSREHPKEWKGLLRLRKPQA